MINPTSHSKFFLIALVIFLCSLLAFAGLAEESAKQGGTVTIPHGDVSLPVMDPHQADDLGELSIGFLVTDPLLRLQEGELVPYLAKSWETLEGGKAYTIHLQEGVEFHNGKKLTASVVKKNIQRIVNNDLPAKGYVNGIESMEVVNDHTLKFNLEASNPDFLSNLTQVHICEPSSWKDLEEGEAVIGTGAFQYVEEEYSPESRMVLQQYEEYWRGTPYLEEIIVRVTGGREATLTQLRKGVMDIAGSINFKDADRLSEEGFKLYTFGKINWASIAINLSEVELPVRKAINYAFNKKAVLNAPTVFAGYGEPQYSIGYPGSYLYNEEVGYNHDPEKARQVLEDAGWVDNDGDGIRERDGEELDLFFPTRTGMGWAQATQMIQAMLKKVGIGSHIETSPSSTFYDMVRKGDYDIAWWLSNDVPVPPIATYQFDCNEYWSVTQVCWEDLQNLLEKAQNTVDKEKRAELYKKVQQIHYERAMEALGIWKKEIHVTSPSLNGFKVTSNGVFFNSYHWWIEG